MELKWHESLLWMSAVAGLTVVLCFSVSTMSGCMQEQSRNNREVRQSAIENGAVIIDGQ